MTSALITIRTLTTSASTAPVVEIDTAEQSTELQAPSIMATLQERRIYREYDGGLAETGGQIARITRDLLRIIPDDLGNLTADSILAKNRGLESKLYFDTTGDIPNGSDSFGVEYLIELQASDFGGYNNRITFTMNGTVAGPMPMDNFIDVVNMARSAVNVQNLQANRLITPYKMILK